jgi:hypothetical protein
MPSDPHFGPIGRVVIELIDHQDQRYNTAGDWFRDNRRDPSYWPILLSDKECTLIVRASRLHDDRGNFFALEEPKED